MASPLRRFLNARRRDVELGFLLLAGKQPIHFLRVAAIAWCGGKVHREAILYHGFEIRGVRFLSIGARSSIGNDAILDARGGLTIGEDVNLSTGVHIWTGQHDWRSPEFAYQSAPVVIGNRAWLSARVTVLPGCTIGEGAVVAAGAVVTRDVGPYSLVGGTPAKLLGERPRELNYRLPTRRHKPWWW